MPTYLYKNIETGEVYELTQSMRDDAYTTHPETGAAIKRILARPGIAFKGSGFYVNDSRKSEGGGESKSKGGE
ncbi:FmdB family zinc ribbon protein [Deinococcus hohokamensis]|uniref:FmdB family transcriptional regulator n=1 Tax=Deinococcus hohokamensis TaxID=309883 RepID=A0ABV9IB80_9DEIO